MEIPTRKRILFVGEAVTLSHVVRPAVLAGALDPDHYDVILACDPRYNNLLADLPFQVVPLSSAIPRERLLEVLAGHEPIFDAGTLATYVEEDVKLIDEYAPNLIVGDMRQSLGISSHKMKIPYLNIISAQWSPYTTVELENPEPPMAHVFGEPLAQMFFKGFLATAGSVQHALPLNVVRFQHGLPPLSWDARHIYSAGDYVAYPDIPEIIPTDNLPPNHSYLGPVLWSPKVALPEWWETISTDRPVIYVSLGSSGQGALLTQVLEALSNLDVTVIAATGGIQPGLKPANAYLADFLPGEAAVSRADVVICNGGSMPVQQSLADGKPVLGLVSNIDQFVFARAVNRLGAGEVLRERVAHTGEIRRLVWRMLSNDKYRQKAQWIAGILREMNAPARFQALVANIVGEPAIQSSVIEHAEE